MRIGKKAILFDRDGVLNIDSGYVYRYENIRWIDGAREAVARLTEEGWLLFVVTNQSGAARGTGFGRTARQQGVSVGLVIFSNHR